jgi:hypothetical protein
VSKNVISFYRFVGTRLFSQNLSSVFVAKIERKMFAAESRKKKNLLLGAMQKKDTFAQKGKDFVTFCQKRRNGISIRNIFKTKETEELLLTYVPTVEVNKKHD